MKVLLFTHKNDIDGMGNAVLSKLAFNNVDIFVSSTSFIYFINKNVLE